MFFRKKTPAQSVIVFDMDNTLVDEFGSTVRPQITVLLQQLQKNYRLVLWTNSTAMRARSILAEHRLNRYFHRFIYREDYDPEQKNIPKDLRKIDGRFIIDDDPAEIQYNRQNNIPGYCISPYRKSKQSGDYRQEIRAIYREITGI